MEGSYIISVLLVGFLGVTSVRCDSESDFELSLHNAVDFINNNATLRAALSEHLKLFGEDYKMLQSGSSQGVECPSCPPKYKWPCQTVKSSGPKPTSVHQLRPSDIDVVGAIGDSITAANGLNALTILGCLINYRGKSWSIGGEGDISTEFTLPNILKVYNPQLKGFSTGNGLYRSHNAHLNLAVAGAKSEDMVTQAVRLVERMRTTTDLKNDWKVVTLFIGGNDLCASCKTPSFYKSNYYTSRIQYALDILHTNLPRTFVNVVPMLDVSFLDQLNQGLICSVVHTFVCKCGAYPNDAAAKATLKKLVKEYQDNLTSLVESGRYDTRDDFTVVIQPFFKDTKLPMKSDGSPDLSYFAPDCFHFSRKGHRNAAEALWNNMIEPVGKKRTSWVPHEQVECPSKDNPYLFTYKNSGTSSSLFKQSGSPRLASHDTATPSQMASYSAMVTGTVCSVVASLVLIVVVVIIRRRRSVKSEEGSLLAENNVVYS